MRVRHRLLYFCRSVHENGKSLLRCTCDMSACPGRRREELAPKPSGVLMSCSVSMGSRRVEHVCKRDRRLNRLLCRTCVHVGVSFIFRLCVIAVAWLRPFSVCCPVGQASICSRLCGLLPELTTWSSIKRFTRVHLPGLHLPTCGPEHEASLCQVGPWHRTFPTLSSSGGASPL